MYVDLFERSQDCHVAAGDAEQWAATYERLAAETDRIAALYQLPPWEWPISLQADLHRANTLTTAAYEAMFTADQYGRVSRELYTNEAELIRRAIS